MTSRVSFAVTRYRCVACAALEGPDEIALEPIGPGPDADARRHAARGEPFTPYTIPLCRRCRFGFDDDDPRYPKTPGEPPP